MTVGPVPPAETVRVTATLPIPTLTSVGQTITLTADVDLSDGSTVPLAGSANGIAYASSNPNVASVDANGVVTAVSAGTAGLSATRDGAAGGVQVTVSLGDPLTQIVGSVQTAAGLGLPLAAVETSAGVAGTTDLFGNFALVGHPTSTPAVRVDASSGPLFGFVLDLALVPGGITQAGAIVVDLDTDGDGLPNWYELQLFGTSPTDTDSDGDGLSDGVEVFVLDSNPASDDSDGDGFLDGIELALGTGIRQFDQATTLTGAVALPPGIGPGDVTLQVAGVPLSLSGATVSGGGGFAFDDSYPVSLFPVTVIARAERSAVGEFTGRVADVPLATGGTTDVGTIDLLPDYGEFTRQVLGAGRSYGRVLPGHFDGDAFVDVVAVGSNELLLHRGRSNGFFDVEPVPVQSGFSSLFGSLDVADFDADGIDDVLTVRTGSVYEPFVHFGGASGTFSAPLALPPSGGLSYAAADYDGNGTADVISWGGAGPDKVHGHAGGGDGTFAAPVGLDATAGIHDLVVAPLDAQPGVDLALLTSGKVIQVLSGDGLGGFTPAAAVTVSNIAVNANQRWLAAGDVDGDGAVDLAVAASGPGFTQGVELLFGPFTGPDPTRLFVELGHFPTDCNLADVDGLPGLDVVAANQYGALSIASNDGTGGSFALQLTYDGKTHERPEVVDVNQDGLQDILLAASVGEGPTGAGLRVLTQSPQGEFGPPLLEVEAGNASIADVRTGDFDGDGHRDFAGWNSSFVVVTLSDGNGGYLDATLYAPSPGSFDPESIDVADLDGDGRSDVVVAAGIAQSCNVFHGQPDGTLVLVQEVPVAGDAELVALHDVNGDGLRDALVSTDGAAFGQVDSLCVLPGLPGGLLGPPQCIDAETALDLAVGDLDRDGEVDVAAVPAVNDAYVCYGLGGGALAAPVPVAALLGGGPGTTIWRSVAIGDFSRNGFDDLLLQGTKAAEARLLVNEGARVFTSQFLDPSLALATFSPAAVTDVDADGLEDAVFGGSGAVHVLYGDGDGSFRDRRSFFGGQNVVSIEPSDVDLDGLVDLAIGNALVQFLNQGEPITVQLRTP